MSSPAIFQHEQNARLVSRFLQAAHTTPSNFMSNTVAAQVKCWGFPEFNPQNRDEYLGFFNYLGDVFDQMDFRIEQCLAETSQVLVRFCIRGIHHEEFMGLPATGCQLIFNATALFRLAEGVITEVWMYNKQVSLKTRKGTSYQLQSHSAEACCPKAIAS